MTLQITPLRDSEDLCAKAFVHWKAWHETYIGLVSQSEAW